MSVALASSPKTGLTRAEAYEWVVALKADGWTTRQIADELCVSVGYIRDLLWDQTGEKARERKRRCLMRPCERCGRDTWGRLCVDCDRDRQHAEKRWTREAILDAFRAFAAVAGRAPAVTDCPSFAFSPTVARKLSAARLDETERFAALVTLPSNPIVYREFGSWRACVLAAGLTPAGNGGGASHRGRRPA